ncbi:cell wall protein [Bacillus cereus]|nr:cell wall protein [Bacillus cereus]PGU62443.1 cell wall protein [Bacillus cereus]
MKKGLSILLSTLLIWLGIGLKNETAFAGTMNYSVKANIPENQINKKLTYFDLRMKPGAKQTISLTVQNTSTEEIELMIEPNTAITNQNGVIDYSKHEHKKDSSLQYPFSELISPKQKVLLKGKEQKEVPFTIQMPQDSFDGMILGGFYIYKISKDDETQENTKAQIKNEFSYVIGVKLTETDVSVQPNLTLNHVQAGLMNYRTVVTANLQNTAATIVNNLEVNAKITKEGQKEVLHETTSSKLSMAPNSNFDFPINWDNKSLKPGKYHLYITAKDANQTWKFDKMFEISGKEAKKINKTAVEVEKDYTWLFLGIGALILVIIIIIIILLKKKKRGKSNEDD